MSYLMGNSLEEHRKFMDLEHSRFMTPYCRDPLGGLVVDGKFLRGIEVKHVDDIEGDFIVGYGPERSIFKPARIEDIEKRHFLNGQIVGDLSSNDLYLALDSALALLYEQLPAKSINVLDNPDKIILYCKKTFDNEGFSLVNNGQMVVGYLQGPEKHIRQVIVILPIEIITNA